MVQTRLHLLCLIGFALSVAGGCAVGPDYTHPPAAQLDTAYPSAKSPTPEEGAPAAHLSQEMTPWWRQFNDPVLQTLTQRAIEQNLSLKEAAYRICESRAKYGTVQSGLFPQVDTDGTFYHQKRSTASYGTAGFPGGAIDSTADFWSWGTNLAWEIDVFGRVQRLLEAAEADIDTNVELYHDAMVILIADVGRNYVDARTFQEQIKIVEQNIEIRQQTQELVQAKFDAGTISELDLAQANANLDSTRAELPVLATGYRRSVNRLSVLLGAPPGEVDQLMAPPRPIPTAPDRVVAGIPAELLRRRPDIRAAERRVAAQTARIGVAVADLYPMFSINGTFGLDAEDLSRIFTSDSINAGIGPSFRWNILNFGRYRCNITAQRFLQRQLIAQYQQTVLRAAEEVDNALAAFVEEQKRYEYLEKTVASYARALEISQRQYKIGRIDFQPVLDSQRALLIFQGELAQSRSNLASDVILLYRALGGGWQTPPHVVNIDPSELKRPVPKVEITPLAVDAVIPEPTVAPATDSKPAQTPEPSPAAPVQLAPEQLPKPPMVLNVEPKD